MPRKNQKWVLDPSKPKGQMLVPYQEFDRYSDRVHFVMPDILEYQSPVSLMMVSGRRQRREDLKQTGCREVDPSEKKNYYKPPPDVPLDIDWGRVEHDVFGSH